MRYCTNCILPESYPGIKFDEQGVCNFCQEHNVDQMVLGREKLDFTLSSLLTKINTFDCVVPVSGGKDSAYVLYYSVKDLGLKPLAVSYNSGFQNRFAEDNMVNMCEKLGVPLHIVRPPGRLQQRVLRESFILAKKYGVRWWGTCNNCEPILRTVTTKIARKYHVPVVMWGSSVIEAADITKYKESQTGKGDQAKKNSLLIFVLKLVTKILTEPRKVVDHSKLHLLNIALRFSMGIPFKYAINPLSTPPLPSKNPKFLPFFDYIQWDSIRNTDLLETELGWKHPDGRDSRFDCELHCVNNYNLLQENGITGDGESFCRFIRDGKISREEGKKREEVTAGSVALEYQELLQKLDLANEKPL